jgi:purine-binding chemotaxis protein CheW
MADLYNDNFEETTQKGRYLIFTVAEAVYGMSIHYVMEIIRMQNITKVPGTPSFVKGVINLRGKIVPVIDLRLKFGQDEIKYTERTCVVVIEAEMMQAGLIVDRVDDVLELGEDQIASPDELQLENPYVSGVALGKFILDATRLLKHSESMTDVDVQNVGEQ